jgi:CBS domain-containing membrane protein
MKIELPDTVSEIMSREVVSVEESDSLLNLLESMRALRFRHLPVTDGDHVIGLLTERDLSALATSSLLPHHAEQSRDLFERFRVRDVMVRDVISVSPDTPLVDAGRLLLSKRIGCLPVVDPQNVLVGIVTSSDFVASLTRALTHSPSRG